MGLALTVGVAMLAAVLLSLPVAWVYLVTRAKRGYQQSVVQLLIILPAVVAGIVLLVKYSLALAFSLAGIVAAVRFRNTLDDSKDAVYVFLATAIGLAAAVNLPVAAVISIGFNTVVLVLWYTDFGSAPMELEGRIAEQRLKRARQLARTGTFVARIDDEVFQNMTREQLEGVAQRAWRRAQASTDDSAPVPEETRVRIRTNDIQALRRAVEPRLTEHVKHWRLGGVDQRRRSGVRRVHRPPQEKDDVGGSAGAASRRGVRPHPRPGGTLTMDARHRVTPSRRLVRAPYASALSVLLVLWGALASPTSTHAQAAPTKTAKESKDGKPPKAPKEPKPMGEKEVPVFFRSGRRADDDPHDEHQADPARQVGDAAVALGVADLSGQRGQARAGSAARPHARHLEVEELHVPPDEAQLQRTRRRSRRSSTISPSRSW